MPIGNQEIWDKGIGAGATNVIFGQQPQRTNYNLGALGTDPNAPEASPESSSATDALPSQTSQQQPVGDQQIGSPEYWEKKNQGLRPVTTPDGIVWMTEDEWAAEQKRAGYGWQFHTSPNKGMGSAAGQNQALQKIMSGPGSSQPGFDNWNKFVQGR